MDITPERMQLAYDLIVGCPPFVAWNLPAGEDVTFRVMHSRTDTGWYKLIDGKHVIACSTRHISTIDALVRLMSHEIIHLHERETGIGTRAQHSAAFQMLAGEVCAQLGFSIDGF